MKLNKMIDKDSLKNMSVAELVYKRKDKENAWIVTPEDLFRYGLNFYNENQLNIDFQEYLILICLSKAGKVINSSIVSKGGIDSSTCDIRIILATALLSGASNIALIHNHPQSQIRPSTLDKTVTSKIGNAAKIMDIKLIDHVIIGEDRYMYDKIYHSMQEHGEL